MSFRSIAVLCFVFLAVLVPVAQPLSLQKEAPEKQLLLCWVRTNHKRSGMAVLKTWGSQCDKVILFTSKEHNDPHMLSFDVQQLPGHLAEWERTKMSLTYMSNEFSAYSWFLIARDNSYVVVSNLKTFLSQHDPRQPHFFGRFWPELTSDSFHAPGSRAGYVLSKGAVDRIAADAEFPKVMGQNDEHNDVTLARALASVGIQLVDVVGSDGLEAFLPVNINLMRIWNRKTAPAWFYPSNPKAKELEDCCSRYWIGTADIDEPFDMMSMHEKVLAKQEASGKHPSELNQVTTKTKEITTTTATTVSKFDTWLDGALLNAANRTCLASFPGYIIKLDTCTYEGKNQLVSWSSRRKTLMVGDTCLSASDDKRSVKGAVCNGEDRSQHWIMNPNTRILQSSSGTCLGIYQGVLLLKTCNFRSLRQRWTLLNDKYSKVSPADVDANLWRGMKAHIVCEHGLGTCIEHNLRISNERRFSQAGNLTKFQEIHDRVAKLDVANTAEKNGLPLRIVGPQNYPVRPCNMTAVEEWKRYKAARGDSNDIKELTKKQSAGNFQDNAVKAIHATQKAFALAQLPIALTSGTALGWYRECGIIAHTLDVDLMTATGYIINSQHYDIMVEAMNFYGLTGPVTVFGNPLKSGSEMRFIYFASPGSNDHVQVDIFVPGLEGHFIAQDSWAGTQTIRCDIVNSGFQYVDFFGVPILAPLDIQGFLVALYGPNFLIPQSQGSSSHCDIQSHTFFANSKYFVTHQYNAVGMFLPYAALCDQTMPDCRTCFAAEFVVARIFKFIRWFSLKEGLRYTILCDSLRYLIERGTMRPWYGAIGILASDLEDWMRWINSFNWKLTTFVLEKHDDGSIMHIRYSSVSSTRVIIHVLPNEITSMQLDNSQWHYTNYSVITNVAKSTLNTLYGMCSNCVFCRPMELENRKMQNARIRNIETQKCLTITKTNQVILDTCSPQNSMQMVKLHGNNDNIFFDYASWGCLQASLEEFRVELNHDRCGWRPEAAWHIADDSQAIIHGRSRLCLEADEEETFLQPCDVNIMTQRWEVLPA